jgi:protein-tyrosine phosphatase
MELWFLLVCASVLTTYQHHFIDIPTGVLLGMLCLWLWPFENEGDGRSPFRHWRWTRDAVRLRVGAYYSAGALLLACIAFAVGGTALWLLWGSVSLLLVALAYFALGARAFQKRAEGRLAVAARWLFAPYVAGAWINSRAWTWRHPHPVEVADGVFLGRFPAARELAGSKFAGVIDLTAEVSLHALGRDVAIIPVLDLTEPSTDDLARAANAIEQLRKAGPVLVCCALGCSRSACAIAAWLLMTGRAGDVDAAVNRVRAARDRIVLDGRHVRVLDGIDALAVTNA